MGKLRLGGAGGGGLVGFFAGEPDGVGAAFGAFVGGGDRVFADIEAGFAQDFGKCLVGAGRPYGEQAAAFEGRLNLTQALEGVKAVVVVAVEGGRTVINVEDDGVVVTLGLADELLHGLDLDGDPGVVEEAGMEVGEVGPVPVDNGRGEFGDGELDPFSWQCPGGGGEGVSHAESADEDFGLVHRDERFACELGQGFLGPVREAGHELLALGADHVDAVVFNELEGFAFGGGGLGNFLVRFHRVMLGGRESVGIVACRTC